MGFLDDLFVKKKFDLTEYVSKTDLHTVFAVLNDFSLIFPARLEGLRNKYKKDMGIEAPSLMNTKDSMASLTETLIFNLTYFLTYLEGKINGSTYQALERIVLDELNKKIKANHAKLLGDAFIMKIEKTSYIKSKMDFYQADIRILKERDWSLKKQTENGQAPLAYYTFVSFYLQSLYPSEIINDYIKVKINPVYKTEGKMIAEIIVFSLNAREYMLYIDSICQSFSEVLEKAGKDGLFEKGYLNKLKRN